MPARNSVLRQTLSALIGVILATVFIHHHWRRCEKGTPARGMLDIACHFGTASAVLLPVLPQVQHRRAFSLAALLSAVAIDLDHIAAARSLEMRSWMTMPSRPPTHSVLALLPAAWLVERLWPGQRLWLAISLGVGSHLLRDLATGGAPIWHPKKVIALPHPIVVAMLAALASSAWFLAGMPLFQFTPNAGSRVHDDPAQPPLS
jgi:membrane-bound metal-dependent hydrolase YbcI (DUF457 family)